MSSEYSSTVHLTQEELQQDVQMSVSDAEEWTAELPFIGLRDYDDNESVDLFSFITNGPEFTRAQFNPDHCPPTNAGRKKLLFHLQQLALKYHGTDFNVDSYNGTLRCARNRKYAEKEKNKDEYDAQGVRVGLRHKSHHPCSSTRLVSVHQF
ncbi:unnamed protein product [Cylindrotheca closterium]|uniref:Uncharacterized protein n=1 Tax=Cylindrotheca closterium TaxID=2856 RepID=A0AAD2CQV8_9STRA|nr:unnamed protein product [Cylindrotheca closterium]